MQKVIVIIVIFVYILIGMFASGFIQEDWEKPSIMLMILWPLVLFLYVLFSLVNVAYELGKKMKDKLFN